MSNFTDGNWLHQILTTVLFLKLISSPLACCPRRVLERGEGVIPLSLVPSSSPWRLPRRPRRNQEEKI